MRFCPIRGHLYYHVGKSEGREPEPFLDAYFSAVYAEPVAKSVVGPIGMRQNENPWVEIDRYAGAFVW